MAALIAAGAAIVVALIGAGGTNRAKRNGNGAGAQEISDITKNLVKEHLTEIGENDSAITALEQAVAALTAQQSAPNAPPGIDQALSRLAVGETADAENIFETILAAKQAEGQSALKEAAAAARHIGALAFLHDTEKALRAYARSA